MVKMNNTMEDFLFKFSSMMENAIKALILEGIIDPYDFINPYTNTRYSQRIKEGDHNSYYFYDGEECLVTVGHEPFTIPQEKLKISLSFSPIIYERHPEKIPLLYKKMKELMGDGSIENQN